MNNTNIDSCSILEGIVSILTECDIKIVEKDEEYALILSKAKQVEEIKAKEDNLTGEDIQEGLYVVFNIVFEVSTFKNNLFASK